MPFLSSDTPPLVAGQFIRVRPCFFIA